MVSRTSATQQPCIPTTYGDDDGQPTTAIITHNTHTYSKADQNNGRESKR